MSDETRQRVLEAVGSLSFQPNRLARALVTTRSHTVGVIVHDISDPYFGELVKGLEDGIQKEDYRLFVASSERDPEKELDYVRAFQEQQVDAIVFAASSLIDPSYAAALDEMARRFKSRGGVMVTLSEHLLGSPRVAFDNRRAVRGLVEYLVKHGHRRIGYLGGPANLEVSRIRLDSFVSSAADFGLATGPEYVSDGGFTAHGGDEAVRELFGRVDVTAILAASDLMAIGAMHGLRALGLSVPDDVSVVGIDDIPFAVHGPVPLTTMRVPLYEVGLHGATLVLEGLGSGDTSDIWIEGEIVERDSVRDIGDST